MPKSKTSHNNKHATTASSDRPQANSQEQPQQQQQHAQFTSPNLEDYLKRNEPCERIATGQSTSRSEESTSEMLEEWDARWDDASGKK